MMDSQTPAPPAPVAPRPAAATSKTKGKAKQVGKGMRWCTGHGEAVPENTFNMSKSQCRCRACDTDLDAIYKIARTQGRVYLLPRFCKHLKSIDASRW